MKYCENCRLSVNGSANRCPLCQSVLHNSGSASPDVFPHTSSIYKKYSLIFKLLLFSSIAISATAITLNIIFTSTVSWSVFVISGILCGWAALFVLIAKRDNIHKTLLWLVMLTVAGSALWDYFTGWRGWSVNYVLPITFISAMAVMSVMTMIFKSARGDYIIYTLLNCMFSLMLIALIISDIISSPLASIVCVCASVIDLSYILIFKTRDLREELKRRLHF